MFVITFWIRTTVNDLFLECDNLNPLFVCEIIMFYQETNVNILTEIHWPSQECYSKSIEFSYATVQRPSITDFSIYHLYVSFLYF